MTTHTLFADIKGMGQPARDTLAESGYTHLEQLTSATEKELLMLHGMGPKAMRILKEELRLRNLTLRVD